jgi:hypothetical protein
LPVSDPLLLRYHSTYEMNRTRLLPSENLHENPSPSQDGSASRSSHPLVNAVLSSASGESLDWNDTTSTRRSLVELAQHAFQLERQLATLMQQINSRAHEAPETPLMSPFHANTAPVAEPTLHSAIDSEDDDVGLSEHLKQLILDSSRNRFFGPSSSIMLLRTAVEAKMEANPGRHGSSGPESATNRRPEFWSIHPVRLVPIAPNNTHPFHSGSLHHRTPRCSSFRNTIYCFISLTCISQTSTSTFHYYIAPLLRSLLLKVYTSKTTSSEPQFLHCVLLHLDTQTTRESFSTIPIRYTVRAGNGFGKYNSSDNLSSNHPHYMSYKLIVCVNSCPQSSDILILSQLCVLYLQGTSTPEACWTMVGIAIRYAQDRGVHRRKHNQKPSIESELWKRAFWLLVCMDTAICSFLGRPRATNSDEYVHVASYSQSY